MSKIQIEPYDFEKYKTYTKIEVYYENNCMSQYNIKIQKWVKSKFFPHIECHTYVVYNRQDVIDLCYHFGIGNFEFWITNYHYATDAYHNVNVGLVYNYIFPEWVEREKDIDDDGDWVDKEIDWLEEVR